MRIGDKVRKYRVISGMTTSELGMRVGFSHKDIGEYIRAYEAGKVKPCRATREKLADALNMPVRRMLDREIESEDDIDFIFQEMIEDDGFSVELIQEHLDKFRKGKKKKKSKSLMKNENIIEICKHMTEAEHIIQSVVRLFYDLRKASTNDGDMKFTNDIYVVLSAAIRELCGSRYYMAKLLDADKS